MAVPRPQTPLQGAFAVAARTRSRIQEKTGGPDRDSLLHPSRIGVSFLDDAAVGVIKGLLKSVSLKRTYYALFLKFLVLLLGCARIGFHT